MKEIHKKWLIALQTSRKGVGSLFKVIDGKECSCCLGVLAETANIEKTIIDTQGSSYYSFKKAASSGTFEDWLDFDLHGRTGGFYLKITIRDSCYIIRSLTSLNDGTTLNHKDISKFIYIFKDKIFKSDAESIYEEFVFKNDQEFKKFIKERAAKSNYRADLAKWKKEFKIN